MLHQDLRLTLLAIGVLLAIAAPARAAVDLPDGFVNEVIAGGLDQPNSMAFLPDGRVLFTEQRTGKVRMVVNGHLAAGDPLLVVPHLNAAAYERGLQGIAVDPRWPARPYVYLYYTRRLGTFPNQEDKCRLVRYRASGDVASPLGEILTLGSPLILIDDIADEIEYHQAGCLRFSADHKLFVSVGEDEDFCAANDPTQMKGVLLRLDVARLGDGSGGPVSRDSITPASNPIPGTDPNARLVWAYGLRNPWRFQIDPESSLIYGADVGENLVEEIDEIRPGDDLGWPWREGNVTVPRLECPEPGGPGAHPYVAPIVELPRGPDLTAILSAGRYRPAGGAPANWPAAYHGDVFWAEYYSGVLRRVENLGSSWLPAAPVTGQPDPGNWATGLSSAVDFLVGPDGSLWWLRQFDEKMQSASGSLQRIRWMGPTVGTPAAAAAGVALSSRPNPFSSSVEFGFRLAAAGYARLELFDLSGRLVRRLLDAGVAAGEHRERWDGLDRNGRPAAAGVYVVRLETAAGVLGRRVLRVH